MRSEHRPASTQMHGRSPRSVILSTIARLTIRRAAGNAAISVAVVATPNVEAISARCESSAAAMGLIRFSGRSDYVAGVGVVSSASENTNGCGGRLETAVRFSRAFTPSSCARRSNAAG